MEGALDRDPARGTRLVVRVWLPDRPGALGLVASRIGAIGADIVGIDVLERSGDVAVDEFAVVLPSDDLLALLVREIEEVDGASIEEWHRVESFPDPRLDALATVEMLCGAAQPDDLPGRLVDAVRQEFEADWAALVRDDVLVAATGDGIPAPAALSAFVAGTSASPAVAAGESGPGDLAVAPLDDGGTTLLVGRSAPPFRLRERRQLRALGRIADRIGGLARR
jgi:hypothetical protein